PGEGTVEWQTRSGQHLAQASYLSDDGEHGYVIAKAQWTPDSMFFVYSLQSSGGHQPWHSPVQYFSRKDNNILSLDDALNAAVTSTKFGITPPNTVTVEIVHIPALYAQKTATAPLSALQPAK